MLRYILWFITLNNLICVDHKLLTTNVLKFNNLQNVKIPSSGTQLVEVDKERITGAKHTMTEQTVRQKSVISKNDVSNSFVYTICLKLTLTV